MKKRIKLPSDSTPGERLERWITYRFGTKTAAASEMDLERSKLTLYTKGERFPSLDFHRKAAEWGLNLTWWIVGIGPMEIDEAGPQEGRSARAISSAMTDVEAELATAESAIASARTAIGNAKKRVATIRPLV